MNISGRFKKVLIGAFVFFLVVILSIEFLTQIVYKNEIREEIQLIINDRLESEIDINRLSISILKNFPYLTVTLKDVQVNEGPYEILKVGKLETVLSLSGLIKRDYAIRKISVSSTTYNVEIDTLGKKFQIKGKPKPVQPARPLNLNIPKIIVKNSYIKVNNRYKKNRQVIAVHNASLSIESLPEMLSLKGNVDGNLDSLISRGNFISTNFPLKARNAEFRFDLLDKRKIFNGKLILDQAKLRADGVLIPAGDGNLLDIVLQSDKGKIEDFLPLLKSLEALKLRQINPNASMRIKLHNHGYVSPVVFPGLDLNFELKNATLTRDGMQSHLENVNLEAFYSNGEQRAPITTKLVVKRGFATLKDNFIEFEGQFENFEDPIVDFKVKSNILLEELKPLLNFPEERVLSGQLDINAIIRGRLSQLDKDTKNNKRKYEGQVKLTNVSVDFPESGHSFEKINGSFLLEKRHLEINAINGNYNNSSFKINGEARNLMPLFVPSSQENLSASIDFFIDRYSVPDSIQSNDNGFNFPDNVAIDLQFAANEINFKDYELRKIKLDGSFEKDDYQLKSLNLKFDETDLRAKASYLVKENKSYINFFARGGTINLDKYLTQQKGEKEKNGIELSNMEIQTDVQFDKITYQADHYKNLSLVAGFDNNNANIEELKLDFPYGALSVDGNLVLKDELEKVHADVDLDLKALEINELKTFFLKFAPKDQQKDSESFLPQDIDINVKLNISSPQIEYDSLFIDDLSSSFLVSNEFIAIPFIDFEVFGGEFNVGGFVDDHSTKELVALINIQAEEILLDELMKRISKGQQMLFTEENIKGKMDVNGELLILYDKQSLEYQEDDLLGSVKLIINDGELVNFKPISESLKFIKKDVRENILLSNQDFEILFHNEEIVIPPTRFSSNLSNIEFLGYHSKNFDFGFNIRLSAGDLLFGSQKRKKERVKKNDTSFGAFNTFISARTVSGEMKISKIKKTKYYQDAQLLEARKVVVDSTINSVKSKVISAGANPR